MSESDITHRNNFTQLTLSDRESARFWSKIGIYDGDSCWEWEAGRNRAGYGIVYLQKKMRMSHRVAWMLANGPIPDGMVICHHCDNPSCCNPRHLFLGSVLDNIHDRDQKGRHAKGKRNGKCKLTDAQIAEMRQCYAAGEGGCVKLARRFSISPAYVWQIVSLKRRTT